MLPWILIGVATLIRVATKEFNMADWFFPKVQGFRVQGRGLAEDNFAAEDRTTEEIMGREGFQNPLDARSVANKAAIRVSLQILRENNVDSDYLRQLLPTEYVNRLSNASGRNALDFNRPSVLLIEDFGTTGLNGEYLNSSIDGDSENWNAFWFREGEGAKSGRGSNGRAGQGKVTFYRVSEARAVLGFTVRESDGRALLMGRSSFRRNYDFNGDRYERDAFLCELDRDQVIPIQDEAEIQRFREAFHLKRLNEPGLSLVIPFPVAFNQDRLMKTAITDFYVPIARGRLELSIGESIITAENIDEIADDLLSDEVAIKDRSAFSKGFRKMVREALGDYGSGFDPVTLEIGWDKELTLTESMLPDGALSTLRSTLEKGERVAVRCPIMISPKGEQSVNSYFDVHLQLPDTLGRVEEAYVRRDLLIGSEKHLASASYLPKARGLTLIEEDFISAFMADAEEPTHLKWNASRPRLSEDYRSPRNLVRAVRNAMPLILKLLVGGDFSRDVKALANYFSKQDDGPRKGPGGKRGGRNTDEDDPVITPKRKPIRLTTGEDWVGVEPNGTARFDESILPVSCVLETAYEGLDSDPFTAYDPFDFDLTDEKAFPLIVGGIEIEDRKPNRIYFQIVDPEFELRLLGFQPSMRVRSRLTYGGAENGADIDEE
jgi:hypothetical protein